MGCLVKGCRSSAVVHTYVGRIGEDHRYTGVSFCLGHAMARERTHFAHIMREWETHAKVAEPSLMGANASVGGANPTWIEGDKDDTLARENALRAAQGLRKARRPFPVPGADQDDGKVA